MSNAPPPSITLLTCSTRRDLDIFSVLAESVDDLAGPGMSHLVVVPGSEIPAFRRFANARREIVAQEDILPFRLFKVPSAPKFALRLSQTFRRPFYIDGRFRVIRGWILQQIIKIEMARRSVADLVLHTDSDVFLVSPAEGERLVVDGRYPFFRAVGPTTNPKHHDWISVARGLLGIETEPDPLRHYVENCVPWHPPTVRLMVEQVERATGMNWHQAIVSSPQFSEYYLYGLYVDNLLRDASLYVDHADFCTSYWGEPGVPILLEGLLDARRPQHFAMAVQSTAPLSLDERRNLYHGARQALGS